MKPSKKSEGIEDFLDRFGEVAYGRGRIESIENDICIKCGQPAKVFRDDLSRREYTISGLCQKCQDKIFK